MDRVLAHLPPARGRAPAAAQHGGAVFVHVGPVAALEQHQRPVRVVGEQAAHEDQRRAERQAQRRGRRLVRRDGADRLLGAREVQAGLHLARTEQSISAVAADEPAAAALRLPLGAPLIFMSSLFADDADRPLMLLEGRYRPDMYEYRTTMLRSGRGAAARWRQVR